MNNPLHILQTLDRYLTKPAEITIFGRAALALGFPNSPAAFATTYDVDAILPNAWLAAKDENVDFWLAQQQTNTELDQSGLYITHLFREQEIILMPDWLTRRVKLPLNLQKLTVLRPSPLDLILTKMARGDEKDLADIQYLLAQERLTVEQLKGAFAQASVPDVDEIRALFKNTQPKVLALAR